VVILATMIRFSFSPWLAQTVPYSTFYFAVMVAAWIGGWGPGLAASVFSAFLADFFFVEPPFHLTFDAHYILSLSIFSLETAVITMLTEQSRRTASALAETEEQFRTAFQWANVGKAQLDARTGRFVEVNQAFCRLTGFEREELLSMTPRDLTHPDDRQTNDVGTAALLRGERQHYGVEKRYVRKDGTVIWVQVEGSIIRKDGRPHRTIAVILDITARRKAEAALKESNDRWQLTLRGSTDGIYDWDIRAHTVVLSARWKAMRGCEEDEIGMDESEWTSRIHPEDYARVMDAVTAYLERTVAEYRCEYRSQCKDGTYLWVLDRGVAVWDADGPVRMIGSETDITARKQAEEALRASQERLAGIVDTAMDAIISVNGEHRITLFNRAAEQLFACTAQEAVGMPLESFLPARFRDRHSSYVTEFGETGTTSRRMGGLGTIYGRKTNGDEFPVEASISQLNMSGEKVFTVILRDITERVAHEEELQRWKDELEQRVEERTREVRAYQDRLRALATELNLTEQRERRRVAGELHDHLAQMLVLCRLNLMRGKRLAVSNLPCSALLDETEEVVTQCLDYTRTLVADLSPPILHEFGLVAALQWLSERMQRYELTVFVDAPSNEVRLPEDQAVLVFQSIRELLLNVRKHAQTQHAWVSVTREDSLLSILVRDHGVGFDSSLMASIDNRSAQFGLFSVRERMQALGGSIRIDSKPGTGTSVVLSLQIPTPGAPAEQADVVDAASALLATSGDKALGRIRVLLVDDHAMVRQGLHSLLASYSDVVVVGEAADGQEALAGVAALLPDVVVMDINMPRMNGIEATSEISHRFPTITVIGLSVNAGGANQVAMQKAGALTVLTKEAAVEQLYGIIRDAVKTRWKVSPIEEDECPPDPSIL
jgi:PAS domain S-box-containing protein